MNTRDIRPPLRYARGSRRRKMVLDVDLNVPPPSDNRDQVGTSANAGPQVEQGHQPGVSIPPAPIDVEALDDEVVISSPRAFAEAKNNSRRTQGRPVVVDVESEERCTRLNSRNKRRRVAPKQTIVNSDLYINLEGSGSSMKVGPPPLLKEPTFSCPICMGPLVEEMTTKCGHIFCNACIKASLAVRPLCPTCRRKTTPKDIIRVYLPTAN